jgi:hypothetical protein
MRALALACVAAAASVGVARANHSGLRHGFVPCAIAIRHSVRPDVDRRRMYLAQGRIWLPKPSTVIGLSPVRAGLDRFAKQGIEVLAGPPVILTVPVRLRNTYSLVFEQGQDVRRVGEGASVLTVRACGAVGRWSAYAGGYEVRRPVCVPLAVRVGARTTTTRVGIGRRCSTNG